MILDFKLKENDVIKDIQPDNYIFDKDSSFINDELLDLKLKAIRKLIELSEKLDTEDAIKVYVKVSNNKIDALAMILVDSFHSLKEKYFNLIISYYEENLEIVCEVVI